MRTAGRITEPLLDVRRRAGRNGDAAAQRKPAIEESKTNALSHRQTPMNIDKPLRSNPW
jgi:hypothetical protein